MLLNTRNMVTPAIPLFNSDLNYGKNLKVEDCSSSIRTGIWIYLLMVLFEGALRKWFLPSLAGPLLILRDPLCIWILYMAWKKDQINLNYYTISLLFIGFVSIYTAYFLGHGNIYVALYGGRIFLLHFPLIFVISKVLSYEDVLKFGRFLVFITIPMTMLIILQFYSPQTAWINKSVGGEAGGGFSGAMNFFRPPGTFSFTNGNTLFYNLSACFIIFFWFNYKQINRLVLIAATIALLLAIPFSISRSLLFQVIISVGFAAIYTLRKPKYVGGLFIATGLIIGILITLSMTPFFSTATDVLTARFEIANSIEGGINGVFFDRFLGGMIQAITYSSHQPFFGFGLGMGTNVGAMLLSGGRFFLLSEGEWGRVLGELGPVFGLTIIFLRLKLAVNIIVRSYKNLRYGIIMPWILSSFATLSIAQAGWAQPTSLGFCVLLTGFTLASLKEQPKG
jgi:hypothetical protein